MARWRFRVRKEVHNTSGSLTNTQYYVRDAAGSVLAIYNNQIQIELPIYGASRLGVFYKQHNSMAYQLTDHLGNVRAVVSKEGKIDSSTDYYPFGMPMPNRIKGANSYRYAFQGQEKDEKTGKEAFQLRLWDSRIGRWLTTDPMGEFHSPYLGMGNNPISSIDPSGGCVGCDPNAEIGSTNTDGGGFGVTMTESGWVRNDGYVVDLGTSFGKNYRFNSSFFIQYEARVSFIATTSHALGLAVDTQGNAGVFYTGTFGGGLVVSAYTSWTAGFSTADNIYELEGWGGSAGAVVTASAGVGFSFSGEFNVTAQRRDWWNSSKEEYNPHSGVSVGLPIQVGTIGIGLGGYGESSYTKILFSGNVNEAIDYLHTKVHGEALVSKAQISNSISYMNKFN